MLFQLDGLHHDTPAIAHALRAIDPACRVEAGPQPGQLEVQAQMTADQIIAALGRAGYVASRTSEPLQMHVSGGSTCCGSCS